MVKLCFLIYLELRIRDGKKSSPARDCKELFENNAELEDGFYWVDPDGKPQLYYYYTTAEIRKHRLDF